MNKIGIVSPPLAARNGQKKQLSWIDNPSVQELLNVISSILADEYIQIAKQNPEMFKKGNGK